MAGIFHSFIVIVLFDGDLGIAFSRRLQVLLPQARLFSELGRIFLGHQLLVAGGMNKSLKISALRSPGLERYVYKYEMDEQFNAA